jgi:uncharacterized protein involved in exopolysaccharide biosynthesis
MMREHQLASQAQLEMPDGGADVWHYIAVLRRRVFFLLVPFVVVAAIGFTVTMLLPPIYVAEGKLLVESQQIPTDLVRPTITATAKERIQVIEQRVMTRENLLAIVDKYQMFAWRRGSMSGTQLLDLMRQRASIRPFELDQPRRRDGLTIALTVGFEYEQPDVAMRVANELLTLILNEDARNRTSRAQETTNFLAREVKKLEDDLGAIEAQIAEFKRKHTKDAAAEKSSMTLAMLRAEFQEKATLYADAHPEMIRLKRQIAALEKVAAQTANYDDGLETLQNQRAVIQKNLEAAAQKVAAARLGESLERAQFSERLEILEQAILPQKPTKPNRPKFLALSLALAICAGLGFVVLAEMFSRTIWSARDLYGVTDAYLVVAIPYIATKKELLQKRIRTMLATGTVATAMVTALATTHFLIKPLDQLWSTFLVRLAG